MRGYLLFFTGVLVIAVIVLAAIVVMQRRKYARCVEMLIILFCCHIGNAKVQVCMCAHTHAHTPPHTHKHTHTTMSHRQEVKKGLFSFVLFLVCFCEQLASMLRYVF